MLPCGWAADHTDNIVCKGLCSPHQPGSTCAWVSVQAGTVLDRGSRMEHNVSEWVWAAMPVNSSAANIIPLMVKSWAHGDRDILSVT